MPRKKSTSSGKSIPVSVHKHRDKRVNIPTEELRDFVAEGDLRERMTRARLREGKP